MPKPESSKLKKIASRWIHLLIAIPYFALSAGLIAFSPALRETPATTFGTISGLLTLYAVLYAIVETLRLKSVAEESKRAADGATAAITALHSVKGTQECQSNIHVALLDIERQGRISEACLYQIIRLYAAEFAVEQSIPGSAYRNALLLVESYATNPNGVLKSVDRKKLTVNLRTMLTHLSVAASLKMAGDKSR